VQEYSIILDELLTQTAPTVSGILLMTPFFIEEQNRSDPMRKMTDGYVEAVRRTADKYKVILIDKQALFDKMLAYKSSQELSGDCIHPTMLRHLMLAKAFLQIFDYITIHPTQLLLRIAYIGLSLRTPIKTSTLCTS
jgi:hypothetical protein